MIKIWPSLSDYTQLACNHNCTRRMNYVQIWKVNSSSICSSWSYTCCAIQERIESKLVAVNQATNWLPTLQGSIPHSCLGNAEKFCAHACTLRVLYSIWSIRSHLKSSHVDSKRNIFRIEGRGVWRRLYAIDWKKRSHDAHCTHRVENDRYVNVWDHPSTL